MRQKSRQYPYPLRPIETGVYAGMTDWLDPAASRSDRARLLYNMYVPAGGKNQPAVGRPGFTYIADSADSPLGGGGKGQFIGQWTQLDGTEHTILICGGQFYTYDWGSDTATETLEAADFSGESITLSTTARFYAAVLNDRIAFFDGVNTPWAWDGTAGGGLTLLSNCPPLYGQPVVYYSKLVGIKASELNTIVWSEEGDLETGYEAGGFNNSWTPVSTGPERFFAIAATNESAMLFRAQNISEVTGPTTDSFRTDGTRASVSEKEGTISPAVLVHDYGIFFINENMQPHVAFPGGKVQELYYDCRETVKLVPRDHIAEAVVLDYAPYDLVLFGVPKEGGDAIGQFLVYHAEHGKTPNLVGVWSDFTCDIAGVVNNAAGIPTLLHFGEGAGVLFMHGTPTGELWQDVHADDDLRAIHHEVVAHPLGVDVDDEKVWMAATFIFKTPNDIQVDFSAETPGGIGPTLSFMCEGSGAPVFDGAGSIFDEILFGGSGFIEVRIIVEINEFGRYIIPAWRHENTTERFGFVGARFQAMAVEEGPGVL